MDTCRNVEKNMLWVCINIKRVGHVLCDVYSTMALTCFSSLPIADALACSCRPTVSSRILMPHRCFMVVHGVCPQEVASECPPHKSRFLSG